MRFMLYSHDGVGLGHVRRNLTIAAALVDEPGTEVLLATGVDEVNDFVIPDGVDVLKLPGIRKADGGGYEARRLADPGRGIHDLRQHVLTAAAGAFRPDVLLTDKHPTGADGELVGALRATRDAGGRTALGLRDVLDEPDVVGREWGRDGLWRQVQQWHDLVLVYGQRDLLDPLEHPSCPDTVRQRARYCGYVVQSPRPSLARDPGPEASSSTDVVGADHTTADAIAAGDRDGRPLVLATVGAGTDGATALTAFLEASRGRGWRAVAITGPHAASADVADLRALADEVGADVHTRVRQLSQVLSRVGVLVSMGGYNTLLEALATTTPVVCIPRTLPRREQAVRARRFANEGLLRVAEPDGLRGPEPTHLAELVQASLSTDRGALAATVRDRLRLTGARRAAGLLRAHVRHSLDPSIDNPMERTA